MIIKLNLSTFTLRRWSFASFWHWVPKAFGIGGIDFFRGSEFDVFRKLTEHIKFAPSKAPLSHL